MDPSATDRTAGSANTGSLKFLADEAHASASDGHLTVSFRVNASEAGGQDVTVQLATSVADRLLVSLGAALAMSHATDAAEMVKRLTAGLTARR